MRPYGELSKGREPLLPHQFCSDCIIATRGYDFREGHQPNISKPRSARQRACSKSAPAADAFAQRWFQAGCTMQNSSLRCERAIIESD
jgi:hypothetical protein